MCGHILSTKDPQNSEDFLSRLKETKDWFAILDRIHFLPYSFNARSQSISIAYEFPFDVIYQTRKLYQIKSINIQEKNTKQILRFAVLNDFLISS